EDAFLHGLDRLAARRLIDRTTALVMAREDGALFSFRKARDVGATTVYDLPIAHHATLRRILQKEEAQFPGVCNFPSIDIAHTPARLERKNGELAMADYVVVLSGFVRDSLIACGYPEERIAVLPPGCPDASSAEVPSSQRGAIVLHVGRLC